MEVKPNSSYGIVLNYDQRFVNKIIMVNMINRV